MHYLLLYDVVDGFVQARTPHRDAHLALAESARERGDLVLAGAIGDPVDGAALVFQTEDRMVVEEFAERDPYVQAGLVKAWKVKPWQVVVGGTATRASTR